MEEKKKIRTRHKVAVLLSAGLPALAVLGQLKDGHDLTTALTSTHTIVVTCIGVALSAVLWLIARWLDTAEPGDESIEELIEMLADSGTPSYKYVVHIANQLNTQADKSASYYEGEQLPVLPDLGIKKYPSFLQVLARLKIMNETTITSSGAVGLLIEGVDRTLTWTIEGKVPNRRVSISLQDGPIEGHITRLQQDTGLPELRLKSREDKKRNPHGHSPEHLDKLKQYTGEVHGNFLGNFVKMMVLFPIFPAILIGLFWWTSPDKTSEVFILSALCLIGSLLVASLVGLQSKLTRIEIADGFIRFRFAGRLRKEVTLAQIDGYETMLGNRGPIRIIYGPHGHCPSGLIDQKQLINLLESTGINRIDPE